MLFLSLSPTFSTQDSDVILLTLIPPNSWPIREDEVAVSALFWVVSQVGVFPLVALVSVGLGCLRRIFMSSVPSSCISPAHPLGLLNQMPASPAASPALTVRIYHLSTISHAYRGFETPVCSPYFILPNLYWSLILYYKIHDGRNHIYLFSNTILHPVLFLAHAIKANNE